MTAYFGWGTSVLDLAGNKIKARPIPRARSRPAEGCAPASRDRCPRCEDSGCEVFFRAPSCIGERRRRLEAQRTEASDQVLPFDWTNGRHSSDFADLKALAVNVRNRGVIGNAEEHPSLQHALQLLPAGFEGLGIRPDARDGRNVAIERPVILDNLVAGLAHGRSDIRSEHASIISLTLPRLYCKI